MGTAVATLTIGVTYACKDFLNTPPQGVLNEDALATPDGPVLARNMDWPHEALVARASCVTPTPHGQSAGYLGKTFDPFVLNADPSDPNFKVPDLLPPDYLSALRVDRRRNWREMIDQTVSKFETSQDARLLDATDIVLESARPRGLAQLGFDPSAMAPLIPGLPAGKIGEQLDLAPATLSFHLKELMHADLVTQERAGRHLIYRAQFEQMHAVLAYLTDNCCQGEP